MAHWDSSRRNLRSLLSCHWCLLFNFKCTPLFVINLAPISQGEHSMLPSPSYLIYWWVSFSHKGSCVLAVYPCCHVPDKPGYSSSSINLQKKKITHRKDNFCLIITLGVFFAFSTTVYCSHTSLLLTKSKIPRKFCMLQFPVMSGSSFSPLFHMYFWHCLIFF